MNSTFVTNQPVCQSCGLPLESPGLLGTDAKGAPVLDYCIYCLHNGAFTEPSISLDETIERYADHLMKMEHMAHLQARDQAEIIITSLKRWDHAGMHQRIAS
jgi:hypothetical protein